MTRRTRIVLTGFGPFPGVPTNASAQLVPELARAAHSRFPWAGLHSEVLPTEWQQAPERAAALIRDLQPALVLHFGVSSKAVSLVLETRGHNEARALCDAAGRLPDAACFFPDGPNVLLTDLNVGHIAERLRLRGVPAYTSRDAGGYLCNAVLYRSLHEVRRQGLGTAVGFVHLPSGLARRRSSNRGRLTWEQALDGSLEIIAAGLGRPQVSRRDDQPSFA